VPVVTAANGGPKLYARMPATRAICKRGAVELKRTARSKAGPEQLVARQGADTNKGHGCIPEARFVPQRCRGTARLRCRREESRREAAGARPLCLHLPRRMVGATLKTIEERMKLMARVPTVDGPAQGPCLPAAPRQCTAHTFKVGKGARGARARGGRWMAAHPAADFLPAS